MPVDPLVRFLTDRLDDLDKTEVVRAKPWLIVVVTEAAQVGEDRVPVRWGRGLSGRQQA